MLRRVISIRNVGRFRNSVCAPNPAFAKHTLVFAANSYGKTTFCAVMRSAQSGDVVPVIGRQTLGVGGAAPSIDLLFADGNKRLQAGAWSAQCPKISVFDGAFTAQNVHSGDFVDVANRRNLYRVIIGQAGVGLAEQEQILAEESRTKQGELTAAERAIQALAPPGMRVVDFLALPPDDQIDAKITAQQEQLTALREATAIRTRASLATLPIPTLPFEAEALLAKSLEGIGAEAETALRTQIARHHMSENGEPWLAKGIDYVADDRCPFCGRDGVDVLPLVQAYRAIFSDAYRGLQNEIAEAQRSLEGVIGEVAQAGLRTTTAQNLAATEFWRRYCAIDPARFPALDNALAACARADVRFEELLARKAQSSLEPIERSPQLDEAEAALREAQAAIEAYNQIITGVNALIDATKRAAAAGDLATAQAQLTRLQAIKRRHEPATVQACADYQRLDAEKRGIEQRKAVVRQELEDHTRQVIRRYETRINHYLAMFNADFRLVQTSHGYPGGIATSTYQLQINGTNVDLGDNRTPDDRPSFKNTLSAGDRTTLGLAFFLAHLEREPDLAERIVIFDDPFSSQDSFRRSQTIYEIIRVARACVQVIVLSHDARFLKQLWEKCPPLERTAMQFVYHPATGSKICTFDLDDACRGRAAAELDDLMAFRATGAGNPREIIKKLRVVLETHFRTAYSGAFLADDNLGAILGKIREGGDQHSAHAAYDSLDRINDYTAQYHHGEDARGAAEPQLNQTELFGFVNMTLALVNALPA